MVQSIIVCFEYFKGAVPKERKERDWDGSILVCKLREVFSV